MLVEQSVLPFEIVTDNDEEVLWIGKPLFIPFIINGVPFLIFGLIWGMIDLYFFKMLNQEMLWFTAPFFAIHSFPCWGSILNFFRLILVHGNTYYAFTNKRLMLRSGFWGTDFKALDYDRVQDLEVNVNPIENSFAVGTIRAYTGSDCNQGRRIYDQFVAIADPYEVFKRIKTLIVDIKTDWNYPNALRPEVNPGYHSKYNPLDKNRD